MAMEEYKKMGDFAAGVQVYVEGLHANEAHYAHLDGQIDEIDQQVTIRRPAAPQAALRRLRSLAGTRGHSRTLAVTPGGHSWSLAGGRKGPHMGIRPCQCEKCEHS